MRNVFDVIVVGLGAHGSAALYQCAKRGLNALGIDRFNPPHVFGSTHGDSRITRQAIGEGDAYVPFSLRSYEIWQDVEERINAKGQLLCITGGLMMASYSTASAMHGSNDFLKQTIEAAAKHHIAHEILNTEEIQHRFPQFNLVGDEIGYFEPLAGFLRPEVCVKANLELAKALGATIRTNEKVTAIMPLSAGGAKIRTQTDTHFHAKKSSCRLVPGFPILFISNNPTIRLKLPSR